VEASASEVSALNNPPKDRELHQKVQELNQAIESVRRQLEQLQPQR
jgi:prefoldin subunit 5